MFRTSLILPNPSRQGTHLPHDSPLRNSIKYLAISTIQVSSSITIMPPEPIIEPSLVSSSKSTGVSRYCSGMQPPEGPPVCTALNFLPLGIPPPMSYIISLSVIPIGTSTKPVLFIFPTRENIIVPLLPAVPICEYHSAPLLIISGTLAQVLTLFSRLGLSHRPFSDMWVYLALGSPIFPSREVISALDSPQTKAPPPLFIVTVKSKPEPSMSSPNSP
ncbi:hypothetical protein ES708_11330 [subsurface metagenome]